MSEYITEEGKLNDANTVKAQADQTPAACSCECLQDLHNYVLTVDFVNALQNIRSMINDALTNVDLSEIYQRLLLEIKGRLVDVWKHVGLIEDESNQQSVVKQKLLNLPQSELRQGDTRVLTYAKTIEGETSPKQVNDLYVYLGQANGPGATIDEATETNEHISKKWVKIVTMEFNADDSEDINLDDIIKRLEAMEDSIAEIIRIVTSIWAYLCKNWWEFVDTAETVEEIKGKTDATIAQNYYCKEDHNIYVYLKTGGTGDEPEMDWIPLLNAENLPYYQSAWRHTQVVSANAADLGTGEFIGETKFWLKDSNIYVWLPTTEGTPGGSSQWVPLLANFNKNAWAHTKTVSAKPTDTGKFIGETRYSTSQEEKIEYDGDVFVWLPSKLGGPNGIGEDPKWFNITRNKAINDIKNYNPEYVQIDISPDQCSERMKNACENDVFKLWGSRIERYGQMVSLNLGYARGDKLRVAYDITDGAGHGSSYQKDSPNEGWQAIYDAYTKYAFFNRAWGDQMATPAAHANPNNAWSGIDDENYLKTFTFLDMSKLFLGYHPDMNYPLPARLKIDGQDYTEKTKGRQKIEELLARYNIKTTPAGYIELARRYFAPSTSIEYTCYCECWPGNAPTDWRNACYAASGEGKVTAMYNVGGYLDPRVSETIRLGMYKHSEVEGNLRLDSVKEGGIVACTTWDLAYTSQNRIRGNGIIDSPFIPGSVTWVSKWGSWWAFRPYLNAVVGSHVGRSMSDVIDPTVVP